MPGDEVLTISRRRHSDLLAGSDIDIVAWQQPRQRCRSGDYVDYYGAAICVRAQREARVGRTSGRRGTGCLGNDCIAMGNAGNKATHIASNPGINRRIACGLCNPPMSKHSPVSSRPHRAAALRKH
ncbi:MAG TPA: hypothetical protein VF934_06380 [Burkholderiales bacterium]